MIDPRRPTIGRSLSERLYRAQWINTMQLLGHKSQAMTDMYNDDRGLSRGTWKKLELQPRPPKCH